jgi:5'-nucleotidase
VAGFGQGGGRYPQVSGIFFAFDPKKPPNQRIDPKIIKIQNEYLDMERVGFSIF